MAPSSHASSIAARSPRPFSREVPGVPDPTRFPTLLLGTAPDSWGVWFPDDPEQVGWSRYLDEAGAAGYSRTELGPYGYLPTDPGRLADELAARGLALTGGTVFGGLHRGRAGLDEVRADCDREAAVLRPLGARFVVFLPEGFEGPDGTLTQPATLDDEQWDELARGADALGRWLRDEHGLELVVHPHAGTHIARGAEIERFLDATDPEVVHLCLDTGHVAYCGGDNLAIIRGYGERIRYVHLKSVDPAVRARAEAERLDFGAAVRLGAMVEPADGEPDMPPLLAALAALDRELFCIVEQDLYPCPADVPLPIATRTRAFYAAAGLDVGRPSQPGSPAR
jgi:inosose dehydratase